MQNNSEYKITLYAKLLKIKNTLNVKWLRIQNVKGFRMQNGSECKMTQNAKWLRIKNTQIAKRLGMQIDSEWKMIQNA